MSSTAVRFPTFVYVESDVPEGQSLTEWRHARAVAAHASRAARRRRFRIPVLMPRLRPAW